MSEILFADIDSASVEKAVINAYETIAQTTLYPGDPVRLFLESLAYTLALQNNVINLAGRQNLLAYASGAHLDYIGEMVGVSRQSPSSASCSQRFELREALAFDVIVPAGTRVTTQDGKFIFATMSDLKIEAGKTGGETAVAALSAGAAQNGLVPGQICQLIDPVAYISATGNSTPTLLGSDEEDDERLRSRIHEAPEAFSCAGPTGAYHAFAMSAHPDIAEVTVWSPTPGTVDIRPVLTGGELPEQEVLDAVERVCNADDVRPLTDTVTVHAPELVYFDIKLAWYLDKSREPLAETTRAAVARAVENYRLWQRTRPGRDIIPLRLASMLEQAGVKRIEMSAPAYQKLEGWQLARERVIEVTYGGLEA